MRIPGPGLLDAVTARALSLGDGLSIRGLPLIFLRRARMGGSGRRSPLRSARADEDGQTAGCTNTISLQTGPIEATDEFAHPTRPASEATPCRTRRGTNAQLRAGHA